LPPPCPSLPAVIGHRGAADHAPENTLAGFRLAKSFGCGWVEFDVRLTADNALVVCHDSRLDRTTDTTGRIAAMTLEAVRRCDAGAWFDARFAGEVIPTLEEALTLADETGLGANIEIKADRGLARATAAAVADVLARLRGRRAPVLVSSFLHPALATMQDLAPLVPRGLLLRRFPIRWAGLASRLGCASLHLDHRSLHPGLVASVRRAGYPLLAYTVNDPVRARLLFDWGVTSVFSDVPDIILDGVVETPPRSAAFGAERMARVSLQGAIE
jgi:glycerophosphoryl diester phosphodiesterase